MAMIIPHELSHAWERATLTDADRHTYMEARGFDVWQDLARNELNSDPNEPAAVSEPVAAACRPLKSNVRFNHAGCHYYG
jgi:hypothetical protein